MNSHKPRRQPSSIASWPRPIVVSDSHTRRYEDVTYPMSYMYSGYSNGGYDDYRGYGRADPRDVQMYPVKETKHIQPSQIRVDHEVRPRWTWCLTVMSVIVEVLCCPLFGIIGFVFALHAYSDHKTGDWDRSRYKRKCAWGWTIAGLILGIMGWILLIVIYALIFTGVWAATLVAG